MKKKELEKSLIKRLSFIYKDKFNINIVSKVLLLLEKYPIASITKNDCKWDEKDVVLITYGDVFIEEDTPPLDTLNRFLETHLTNSISTVHVLPFFPYSSDDGFSVIDYYKINPSLGNWHDIKEINKHKKLMFDLVINHVSAKSNWFKQFLKNHEPEKDYFIVKDPNQDLSMVIRPRNTPLLTPFTIDGEKKYVWTTFSDDQIDLNFNNPDVFLLMLEVLLFYFSKGAKIIRLDAIAFLWKKDNTSCLHLPETHEFVKLFRDIFNYLNPNLILLTETNVPNTENLSYFGKGDEAHMIYQFSMPPLLLYSFFAGNAFYFNRWAKSCTIPNPNNTFLNFTASHDGIGVRPLEEIIPEKEKEMLYKNIVDLGGMISTKTNSDGSTSPYELNITYYDALKKTLHSDEQYHAQRFICSQTIMMAFIGIPAFYIHSLLATENNYAGYKHTKRARTLNRKQWDYNDITDKLTSDTHHKNIFDELLRRINIRKKHQAFHPDSKQRWINYRDELIIFVRESATEDIVSINNVTHMPQTFNVSTSRPTVDILSDEIFERGFIALILKPYETIWLKGDHNSFNL